MHTRIYILCWSKIDRIQENVFYNNGTCGELPGLVDNHAVCLDTLDQPVFLHYDSCSMHNSSAFAHSLLLSLFTEHFFHYKEPISQARREAEAKKKGRRNKLNRVFENFGVEFNQLFHSQVEHVQHLIMHNQVHIRMMTSPKQNNGYDCGLYVVGNIDALIYELATSLLQTKTLCFPTERTYGSNHFCPQQILRLRKDLHQYCLR